MKKSFFIFPVLLIVMLAGCDLFMPPPISVQKQLSDQRFNGEFCYYGTGTFFSSWKFDGTNKVTWTVNTYHYIYDISTFEMEIKLQNGHLWSRLWNNEYSEWYDDGAYYFNNLGYLVLDGITYRKIGNNRSALESSPDRINDDHIEHLVNEKLDFLNR